MQALGIFFILAFIDNVGSLSCDCDYKNRDTYCGPVPTCASSLVRDPCGCCLICSKIHGEECGGPWQIYGKCAAGLECVSLTSSSGHVGAGGIFGNHLEPKGVCKNPGEVLQSTQPCFIALKTYQDSTNSGSHRVRRQVSLDMTTEDAISKQPVSRTERSDIQTTNIPFLTEQLQQGTETKILSMSTLSEITSKSSDEFQMTSDSSMVTTEGSTASAGYTNTDYTTEWGKLNNTVDVTTEPISKEHSSIDSLTSPTITETDEMTTLINKDATTEFEITSPIVTSEVTTSTVATTTPCPVKPSCTPEGWFAPTQCDPCTGECWCVHKDGNEIPNSRKHGKVIC